MTNRLRLLVDFTGKQVLPAQELEGKLGYLAIIRNFHGSTPQGILVEVDSGYLRRADHLGLSQEDFMKLLSSYNAEGMEQLLGKTGIAVYKGERGDISGFIPLNLGG